MTAYIGADVVPISKARAFQTEHGGDISARLSGILIIPDRDVFQIPLLI